MKRKTPSTSSGEKKVNKEAKLAVSPAKNISIDKTTNHYPEKVYSMNICPLTRLSNDCLGVVCSFLSTDDIVALNLTSKKITEQTNTMDYTKKVLRVHRGLCEMCDSDDDEYVEDCHTCAKRYCTNCGISYDEFNQCNECLHKLYSDAIQNNLSTKLSKLKEEETKKCPLCQKKKNSCHECNGNEAKDDTTLVLCFICEENYLCNKCVANILAPKGEACNNKSSNELDKLYLQRRMHQVSPECGCCANMDGGIPRFRMESGFESSEDGGSGELQSSEESDSENDFFFQ
jgi:hypothetical protein